jgi:hypothetical protein
MPDERPSMFDADTHYYEPADAFVRHVPEKMRARCMQWANVDGRDRLLVGGRVQTLIPNPRWERVARPGSLWAYFKGENPQGLDMKRLFGDLEPLDPAYQDREHRLRQMDEHGIERIPALPDARSADGVDARRRSGGEHLLLPRLQPMGRRRLGIRVPGSDLRRGVSRAGRRRSRESRGRVACRPWRPRCQCAGSSGQEPNVLVTTHLGVASREFGERWEPHQHLGSFRQRQSLHWIVSHDRDITDFVAALISHRLFDRFPGLRLMSVENGAGWVGPLKRLLKKAHAQNPGYFSDDPVAIFDRHVWVTPFWEDSLDEVLATLPVDRICYGSDWPHAEGTAQPTAYAETVAGLDPVAQRKILFDNTCAAVGLT